MLSRFWWLLPLLCVPLCPALAEAPPLLAGAFEQWDAARQDLAFTQETRFLADDGTVKEERVERYDPSLPDSRRWRLIEVNHQPATDEQRRKWETKKNSKPRKKVAKSPADYVDLEHASLVDETPRSARYEVGLRAEAARLLGVQKITALITVDKESGRIARINAALRQPVRVLLGLAQITDLDIDLRFEPVGSSLNSGEVETGSTASVTLSKLGNPVEYNWSDFKRVTPFAAPKNLSD